MNRELLSINSITVDSMTFTDLVAACVDFGIRSIAPWRHLFEDFDVTKARALIEREGLHVSGLCRGGMFTAEESAERAKAIDDNRRAIDQAAELGADTLVLVCGPVVNKDVLGSERMIVDGIAAIEPYARERGVRLSIEPLHPMMAAGRSAITLLSQALRIAEQFDETSLGVCIDAYHVWWHPALMMDVRSSAGRIQAFHVSDWVTPIQGELSSRGLMGDGCIDLRAMREAVYDTGYRGFTEVEILSDHWWQVDPREFIAAIVERFERVV